MTTFILIAIALVILLGIIDVNLDKSRLKQVIAWIRSFFKPQE